jgi:YidC/Oxa1 family membrane protein insertase
MMKGLAYILTPISFLITLWMPACLQFFFVVSALLQYLQSWLWRQPWLRSWANLGPLVKPGSGSGFLNPASSYQAPRTGSSSAGGGPTRFSKGATISTTARPVSVDEGDLTVSGVASGLKEGWNAAKQVQTKWATKSSAKNDKQRADEYEERRALEDKAAYYRRRAEGGKARNGT